MEDTEWVISTIKHLRFNSQRSSCEYEELVSLLFTLCVTPTVSILVGWKYVEMYQLRGLSETAHLISLLKEQSRILINNFTRLNAIIKEMFQINFHQFERHKEKSSV